MSISPNHDFLPRVQRPTRYLGREINAVFKDTRAVSLRVALLFPDLYEVGMSHLGLSLLYAILNREDHIWAERAYAPAPDLETDLRSRHRPLTSLESGTPLNSFDLLGVSLQYELGYTNLLNMLDLGGVPLLAADRDGSHPVVIGGGPAAFNPEPIAPFFDALVLGDGEEVVLELAEVVSAWKARRGTRQELWQALEALDGVYVPALFHMDFDAAGRLTAINPLGRKSTISKRVLTDLDRVAIPPFPLVPSCQIIHDRLNVEIFRGCTRGCRYCQAGMIYRPVRERDPAAALAWIEQALAATGFEEVSLLSLSIGDYGPLAGLLAHLMDRLSPKRVSVSLPSMRADTLTPDMMAQIKRVRRTGLTLAPEAGTPRLRQVINKNLTEDAILESARRAFAAGWQLLKLYFMIGLPHETKADREGIAILSRQILAAAPKGARPRLNVSLSSFIPKPHTPFQWERQEDLEECRRRLHEVKDRLRQKHIQTKWNSAAHTWLEGIFSRGDRRLAQVLVEAYRLGCRLDAWSEHMRVEPWQEAFRRAGVDPDFYLRERDVDEVLPWDHIDCGVSRDFLLHERARAAAGEETPDCRSSGCQDCGVCDHNIIALQLQDPAALGGTAFPTCAPLTPQPPALRPPVSYRFRLTYAKLEEARWLGHLELVASLYRSLRRARLPLAFSAGFHPLPRVSFHAALPVGVESLAETLDLELTEPVPLDQLVAALNRVLPAGVKILTAQPLARRQTPPGSKGAIYEVTSGEPVFAAAAASHFLNQTELLVTRRRPKKEQQLDLRSLVSGLTVTDPSHLQLNLRRRDRGNLKVTDALAAIFALNDEQTRALRIVKIKSIEENNL
jgi:radical SAM family uncharacterized protein/radical SAM-linked protein